MVEAAVKLHPEIKDKLEDISKILITTNETAIRIISKECQLNNHADRDHCIQYMTAIGLLKGDLIAEDYEDNVASDERIDELAKAVYKILDKLEQRIAKLEKVLASHAKCIGEMRGEQNE